MDKIIHKVMEEINKGVKDDTFTVTSELLISIQEANASTENSIFSEVGNSLEGVRTIIINSDVDYFYTGTGNTFITFLIKCGILPQGASNGVGRIISNRTKIDDRARIILQGTARYSEIVLTGREVECFAFSLIGDVSLRERASEIKEYLQTFDEKVEDYFTDFLPVLRKHYVVVYGMTAYYKALLKRVKCEPNNSKSIIHNIDTAILNDDTEDITAKLEGLSDSYLLDKTLETLIKTLEFPAKRNIAS